jgi:hypothetical protein
MTIIIYFVIIYQYLAEWFITPKVRADCVKGQYRQKCAR